MMGDETETTSGGPVRFRITIRAPESNPTTGSTYYSWSAEPLNDAGEVIDPYHGEDCSAQDLRRYDLKGHGLGYTKAEAREMAEEHCNTAAWGYVDAYTYEPPAWSGIVTATARTVGEGDR